STGTGSNVPTNGTEVAILNLNGGTLKAGATASPWITTGRGTTNPVPQLIVKSGGAIVDSAGFNVSVLPAFVHDSSLGGTPDGGLTKNGSGTLTLSGANTYTGNTRITSGTLALSGSGSIANSANIVVGASATLDVSAIGTLTLGAGQALSNITSTAIINGSVDASSGALALNYGSGTASFTLTSGNLTLGSGTPATVRNTGSALAAGTYTLISNGGGTVIGTAPSSVTVTGGGLAGGTIASLQVSGGQLNLVVATGGSKPGLSSATFSGNTLTINATNGSPSAVWTLLSSTNIALPLASWQTVQTVTFDGTGHLSTNITVSPSSNPRMYYILKQ
ncbi:MAG TPA: autotransporter-associated beta strand repeat-containing protein, partial [Methylomirabilota bacterium]|nr:autotransporter-associated beta strand repeat-containing protein [Methylomirabilota bacterium]